MKKLTYQTGIATTIQFIVMTILNLISAFSKSIHQCTVNTGTCVGNVVLYVLYFIMLTVGFGVILAIGFAAQDPRSRRLAQLLILIELVILMISLFDFQHANPGLFSQASNIVGALLAVWVMWLSFRLIRARGGRVVSRHRLHQHND